MNFRSLKYHIKALLKAPSNIQKMLFLLEQHTKYLNALSMNALAMTQLQANQSTLHLLRESLYHKSRVVYNQDNLLAYLRLVRPYTSPSLNLTRIGGNNDGGYCMLPPPIIENSKPKAISLGVSSDSPWDLDMANRGYQVLEIDGSIKSSPYPNHPNIAFIKKFIGTKNDDNYITLEQVIKDFQFDNKAHNVLQCDIENAEWEMLEQIDMRLLSENFSQIIFEFHRCKPDNERGTKRRLGILEQINKHFVPIWTHFNSNGGLFVGDGIFFCPLIEVCYLRRDLLPSDSVLASGFYRLGIDSQNTFDSPDIPLFFPENL